MAGTAIMDGNGRVVPASEIARIRMRASLNAGPGFAYDGQSVGAQEMAGWNPTLRSPDYEINGDRNRLVARARDLVRNDGWAGGMINRLLDAAVGASFSPVPAPNWRVLSRHNKAFDATWAAEFAAAVRGEWQMWADDPACHADAERTLTVSQMFRLSMRHKIVDGDGLLAVLWTPERVGAGAARYGTSLQVIDPDRLCNPMEQMDTQTRRGGVEIDPLGAPIGYHIRRGQPYDWYDAADAMVWDYMPRETPWGRPVTVHDFERDRAGQHRGLGLLTSVLPRFKMAAKLDTVTMQAMVLRSVMGFFVKSPYDAEQIRMAMDVGDDEAAKLEPSYYQGLREAWHQQHGVTMGGVRVPIMAPGESIETVAAGDRATDFAQFQSAFLRCFAAATGQAEQEVSGDFSQTNYSSYRGASLLSWKTTLRRRQDFVINTAMPVYRAWLEEALDTHLRDLLPANAPDFVEMAPAYAATTRWIGPGRGWIDPVKEAEGELLKLQAGMTTHEDVAADISGAYFLDVIDARQVELAAMQARGLSLPAWTGRSPDNPDERPNR